MRIASLAPSTTAMLQELGVADQIVACTHFCPLPDMARRQLAIGSFSVLNEEKLAATKPDVVITATLVQARGQQRLKEQGYQVLHLDPHRLTDIADNYAELGKIVNREREGKKLQENFLGEFTKLQQESYNVRRRAYSFRVYMEEWHEPPFVSGNWVPDLVSAAGGQSVLIAPGEPSRQITLAELRQADPDLIIQHICLPPNRDWSDHRQALMGQLTQRPGWHELAAVQRGAVISLNDSWFNMPTQAVLQGIKALRQALAGVVTYG